MELFRINVSRRQNRAAAGGGGGAAGGGEGGGRVRGRGVRTGWRSGVPFSDYLYAAKFYGIIRGAAAKMHVKN